MVYYLSLLFVQQFYNDENRIYFVPLLLRPIFYKRSINKIRLFEQQMLSFYSFTLIQAMGFDRFQAHVPIWPLECFVQQIRQLQLNRVCKDLFPVYKGFVSLQIIFMIIKSVCRVVGSLSQKLLTNLSNPPMLKFESFFKQIQKASSPIQTIRIYDQYRVDHGNADEYLAITLRILTRSMRAGENDDPQAVKGFFQRNFFKIKKMDFKKLNSQHIKDIIFFYVKFAQRFKLQPDQVKLIEDYLQQFLQRYNNAKDQKELQLYSAVIFYSIPLTQKYCRNLYEQFLKITFNLLTANPDKYIVDHQDFQKILQSIQMFQNYDNGAQKALTFLVFEKIKNTNISQHFTQKRIVSLLLCIIRIKKNPIIKRELLELIDEVLINIETALMLSFSTLKLFVFNRIIPIIIQYRPNSPILTKFFQIISQSLSSQGKSKIDPRVIVLGISFIPKQHFTQYLSNQWSTDFVKMIELYYQRNIYFFDGIVEYIVPIIMSKKLSWEESFKLYKIIFENIPQNQNQLHKKTVKKLLFATILNTHFYQLNSIQQALFKINKHFKERDKKQKYNDEERDSDNIDLYKYYRSICQYQGNQQTMLGGFNKKDNSSHLFERGKVKFVTDIVCLLLCLKIKLAYSNFSHIEVQNSLIQPQLHKIRYIYNKQKIMKTILFECRFSQTHFSSVYQYLLKLNYNQIILLENVSKILQNNLGQIYQLSGPSIQFLYYFYEKSNRKQLFQLMAAHSQLIDAFLKYLYPQVSSLIIKQSGHIISNIRNYTILAKVIDYSSILLFQNQALRFFNDITKCFWPMFLLNNDQSLFLYKTLAKYVFRTFIFSHQEVMLKMNEIQGKLREKYSNLITFANIKQDFIQSLQPKLKAYILSQTKVSNENSLQVLKEANTSAQNGLLHLKIYLKIIQNIEKSNQSQIYFFLVKLKQFVLQNYPKGLHSNTLKEILSYFIKNNLFCQQFSPQFFQTLSRHYSSQFQYFSHLAVYPIQKPESLLNSMMQVVTLNPLENITNFCLIYSTIQNPSLQLRQFMTKYAFRYRKTLPFFFKVYLSLMDIQAASKLTIMQPSILQIIQILSSSQNEITISESSVVAIFLKNEIAVKNWFDIDTLQNRQGLHLQMVRKMVKKIYPEKQVRFRLLKQEENFEKIT